MRSPIKNQNPIPAIQPKVDQKNTTPDTTKAKYKMISNIFIFKTVSPVMWLQSAA